MTKSGVHVNEPTRKKVATEAGPDPKAEPTGPPEAKGEAEPEARPEAKPKRRIRLIPAFRFGK